MSTVDMNKGIDKKLDELVIVAKAWEEMRSNGISSDALRITMLSLCGEIEFIKELREQKYGIATKVSGVEV